LNNKTLLAGAMLAVLAAIPAKAAKTPEISPPRAEPSPTMLVAVQQVLQEADRLFRMGDWAGAVAMLKSFIAGPVYGQLPEEQHRLVRLVYLQALTESGRSAEAYPELKTLTDSATGDTSAFWLLRSVAARNLYEDADSITSLAVLIERWPVRLAQINDDFVFGRVNRGRNDAKLRREHTQLLLALYDAGWSPRQDADLQRGRLRQDLAEALVVEGRLDKAREVTASITYPSIVASMRMQRRFDLVFPPSGSQEDIALVSDRFIQSRRDQVRDEPDRLVAVNNLARSLYARGRLSDALAVVDEAIAKATPGGGQPSFIDMDQLIWTYDWKAEILLFLGRDDEAIGAMKAGAARPERGRDNISQTLNLGAFYIVLGRPREALALADGVVFNNGVSAYARMVREGIRAQAYAQLGDKAKFNEALDYIRAHRSDSPQSLMNILISLGDDEGAARELVALLKDPDQQFSVLEQVQDYIVPETAPGPIKRRAARLRALRQRPDVQAAMAPVGHVLSLPLLTDW
jgi:tetratricopeptide (TPR) repeat protein